MMKINLSEIIVVIIRINQINFNENQAQQRSNIPLNQNTYNHQECNGKLTNIKARDHQKNTNKEFTFKTQIKKT